MRSHFECETDRDRWQLPVHEFSSLADVSLRSRTEPGIQSIRQVDSVLDILVKSGAGDTVLVVFQGAVTYRASSSPPYFSGLRLQAATGFPLVSVSDPVYTMDATISAGWYLGSLYSPLQATLPYLLDRLIHELGERALFVGGSAGGFAALYYAAMCRSNVRALVFNPQTSLRYYIGQDIEAVARVSFDWNGQGDAIEAINAVADTDVVAVYENLEAPPMVTYMQNASDWHVRSHAVPFCNLFGIDWDGADNYRHPVTILAGHDWGEGHVPPPPEVVRGLVTQYGKEIW
jgi:hypothetical protein